MNAPSKEIIMSQPLRALGHMETNSLGIPLEAATTMVADLNRHVSSLFVLFHQYQKHHWLVEGPNFRDLHAFFEECYREVHSDLDTLAERITALGGIPTSGPSELENRAYVTHEPEGYYSTDEMLVHDLRAEGRVAMMLRHTVRQAGKLGDYVTEDLLKSTLSRVELRAHHLDHYLAKPSVPSE